MPAAERVGVAVEADAELVGQVRREGVVLRQREEVELEGLPGVEDRETLLSGGVRLRLGVVEEAAAERVLRGDVVVDAGGEGVEVGGGSGSNQVVAEGNVMRGACGICDGEDLRAGGAGVADVVIRVCDLLRRRGSWRAARTSHTAPGWWR